MSTTEAALHEMARAIDQWLNPDHHHDPARPRRNGFVLLAFPFGDAQGQRVNYVSNTVRPEMLAALKEIVARFEGRQ